MEEILKNCLPTYKIVESLGQGVHGSVYRIKDRLKERAVKIVPITVERSLSHKTSTDLDLKISRDFHAVQEYYRKIKGDGVIEIHDFHLVDRHVSDSQARAYLVILMELCPKNLLNHVIDNHPVPAREAQRLMGDLVGVLRRISLNGDEPFLFTDLKPSNLLINNKGHLVIGDLGGLKRIDSVSTRSNAQFTLNWTAPEFLLNGTRLGIPATIYSYGLVSYFIWEGNLPYEDQDFNERVISIKENGLCFKRPDMPEEIKGLIMDCMKFSPEDRAADFHEIYGILHKSSSSKKEMVPIPKGRDREKAYSPLSRESHKVTPSAGLKARETWIEKISGITFVWVPGGTFMMGCLEDDDMGCENERPSHEVRVDGFWIGKYPVTQGQWKRVMNGNPSHFRKGPGFPVEQVSWRDSIEFVRRLRFLSGNRFQFDLPTEAQWEFAATSGGNSEKFSGGGSPKTVAWYKANSGLSTHRVGKKAPNGLGIYDMSGNVLEWCRDVYLENAYKPRSSSRSLSRSESLNRTGRGGSWSLDVERCRCAARRGFPPGLHYSNLGLRVVRLK